MARKPPAVGQPAPAFEAVTSTEEHFDLKSALSSGDDNILLVFYRGHWCPADIRQFADIRDNYKRIRKTGTRVFALSVDAPEQSAAVIKEMELPFELLSDVDKQVITEWDLVNPYEHDGIAAPATFVIRPSGIIGLRSLDNPFMRVGINYVIDYLELLKRRPMRLSETPPYERHLMFPDRHTMRQTVRNMALRGTRGDWKHYILFPVEVASIPVKMIRRG